MSRLNEGKSGRCRDGRSGTGSDGGFSEKETDIICRRKYPGLPYKLTWHEIWRFVGIEKLLVTQILFLEVRRA